MKSYWNKQGPRRPVAQRLILTPEGLPAGIAVTHEDGEIMVGLYNWDTKPRDVSIELKQLRIPDTLSSSPRLSSIGNESVDCQDGTLTVRSQPGESLRIVTLSTKDPAVPPSES